MVKIQAKWYLYLVWIQSILAMMGSLYFSEIAKYPPCTLCWYQRVFMYPLAFLIPIAIINKDKQVWVYIIPLAVIGWLIAFYHNLLYYDILQESQATCQAGISCTTKYIEFFGFVTIPLLSLIAFTIVIGAMWLYKITISKS